jgi:hypothetical protein
MNQLVKCSVIGDAIIRALHSSKEDADKLCEAIYHPIGGEATDDVVPKPIAGGVYFVVDGKNIPANQENGQNHRGDILRFDLVLDRVVENDPLVFQVNLSGSHQSLDNTPTPMTAMIPVGSDRTSVFITTLPSAIPDPGVKTEMIISGGPSARVANSWVFSAFVWH